MPRPRRPEHVAENHPPVEKYVICLLCSRLRQRRWRYRQREYDYIRWHRDYMRYYMRRERRGCDRITYNLAHSLRLCPPPPAGEAILDFFI